MIDVHPFYEARRSEMAASMRQRLDLVDDLLQAQLGAGEYWSRQERDHARV
jgi:hypothetical protein